MLGMATTHHCLHMVKQGQENHGLLLVMEQTKVFCLFSKSVLIMWHPASD